MLSRILRNSITLAAALFVVVGAAAAQEPGDGKGSSEADVSLAKSLQSISGLETPCEDGLAAGFPCNAIDLLSFMTVEDLGPGDVASMRLADIWGWTDPETGIEYALVARNVGMSFVDVSDPTSPVLIGYMPRTPESRAAVWRDVKTYRDHAFVVADGAGDHGIQVFDLTRLRGLSGPAQEFEPDAVYTQFGSAHNIVINTESGFAYAVGSSAGGRRTCGGGLHMVDISDPVNPEFAGCFADPATGFRNSGYTHDAQCVTYSGPDTRYSGREICFGLNETALSIADVTDKQNPVAVSVGRYPDFGYVHQGWLTADQRFLLVNDEADERSFARATHTKVFDVSDLEEPIVVASYVHETRSIDHNLYIDGLFGFEANYTAGLRLLDVRDPLNIEEIGYFDTTPNDSLPGFRGAWSVYPFFESGNIVVSSIGEGLFVLNADLIGEEVPEETGVSEIWPNPFNSQTNLAVALVDPENVSIVVHDILGRRVDVIHDGPLAGSRIHQFNWSPVSSASGAYVIRITGETFEEVRSVTVLK